MKKDKFHFSKLIHFGLLTEDDKQVVFQPTKDILKKGLDTNFNDLIELIEQSFSDFDEI